MKCDFIRQTIVTALYMGNVNIQILQVLSYPSTFDTCLLPSKVERFQFGPVPIGIPREKITRTRVLQFLIHYFVGGREAALAAILITS